MVPPIGPVETQDTGRLDDAAKLRSPTALAMLSSQASTSDRQPATPASGPYSAVMTDHMPPM
jgi:hypothetical protein